MDEDEVRRRLLALVGKRKNARITRRLPGKQRHHGFVVAIGREWVLIQQFADFSPEGERALRARDIADVRTGKYERLWTRMLKAEGLLENLPEGSDLPLDDTAALCEALRQRGRNVIIECEDPHEESKEFYIGEILAVDHDAVCFAHFDAAGEWDDEPSRIPLAEITKVQIDSPYVPIFSKYLKGSYRGERHCR